MKEATIVGAGLVGSLWASYLAKRGYKVSIFETREDIRKNFKTAGKSINLALSNRGWKALKTVELDQEVNKIAIPMYGRMIHNTNGEITFQPYGKENQAIYSISRAELNAVLMTAAQQNENVSFFFEHQCCGVDLEDNELSFWDKTTQELKPHRAEVVFACDGAFSAVRYYGLQRSERFNFSQHFISDGYREILLPANEDGTHKIDKNALHIWPRGRFMLIAIPNFDGSFTCTLFMPHQEGQYSFDKVNTPQEVEQFFSNVFPDFYELMPQIVQEWKNHPLSSLAMIRNNPWYYNNVVLMGDAAHATVPFYGQGMNAGFEDCSEMWKLMQQYEPTKEQWKNIFKEFSDNRKPNGDALQDLSMYNYLVMRDYVADPKFLLQKKIEAKFSQLYPKLWLPLYSQVTFSDIPYSVANREGQRQNEIMKQIMEMPNIEQQWESDEVMKKIVSLLEQKD